MKNKTFHYKLGHQPVHLNYRLAGSIPMSVLQPAKARRNTSLQQVESAALAYENIEERQAYLTEQTLKIQAEYERTVDDYLDAGKNGPYHLAKTNLASIVLEAWQFLHKNDEVIVYAVCIMSNHVHAVLSAPPHGKEVDLGKLMKRHKGYTSKMCNRVLGTTGTPFWEQGYFERTIRQGNFTRVMWYVLNNPVKAGLVDGWENWPHCWVNPEYELLFRD